MKQVILKCSHKMRALPIINQMNIMLSKIKFSITVVLKSNLYDWYNPFHLAMGDSTINGCKQVNQVACKNWASFIECIPKIYGTTIDWN